MREYTQEIIRALENVSAGSAVSAVPAVRPPERKAVVRVVKDLQALLFPLCFSRHDPGTGDAELLERALNELEEQARASLCFDAGCPDRDGSLSVRAEETVREFASRLPGVKSMLLKDIEALYEGDPAAKRREEVMICYPGFYAISIYRMAHELYLLHLPLIPRIMTEFAHEKTGIDIHPGATIGEYFFIDHGTGIVVGETTVIGNHVKLYQGVTLGAKSFELDEQGNPVKGIKRHPDIGNNVVIYANATILGGDTVIGDRCVIGGNSWLIRSVEPGVTIAYVPPESRIGRKEVVS